MNEKLVIMHRNRASAWAFTLLLIASGVVSCWFFIPPVAGATRLVPYQYPTIQAAIDASHPKDTIQVSAATYNEHLHVDVQSLTIIGESKTTTIIDGTNTGTVISLEAKTITIRGFTIRNGGQKYNGIVSNTFGGHTISGNIISNNVYGIIFFDSTGNTISGNKLFNNSMYGIALTYSGGNTIFNNDISDSAYGIELTASNTTSVVRNRISDNSYGVYSAYSTSNTIIDNILSRNGAFGIRAANNDHLTVRNNTVSQSAYGIELHTTLTSSINNNTLTNNSYGIYLSHSRQNTLKENIMKNNDWGMQLYNSTGNTIIDANKLSTNTWGMYITTNSGGNTIYRNNFINNIKQMYMDLGLTNTWDNGTHGNYWSDYKGADLDGNGEGDTMLPHLGVDYHPLMKPYEPTPSIWRDVAVLSVTTNATQLYAGRTLNINVTVKNEGQVTETFNVTVRYDSTVIATQTIPVLIPDANTTVTFNWDTTTVNPTYYTISATAEPVPNEIQTIDNTLTDGVVHVKIPGDVNGDGTVNILDAGEVSAHWYPGPPIGPLGYDPNADINNDGSINVIDIATVSANWGRTE